MDKGKTDIWVYAHWVGMYVPKLIGVLSANIGTNSNLFSFAYDEQWISSQEQILLDPDLKWFSGPQYPENKDNFGMFLDSMPDVWGQTLMQRRENQRAKEKDIRPRILNDIDFLLGVYDECRMGALRFKLDPKGPFIDQSSESTVPPSTSLKELQEAVKAIEGESIDKNISKWIKMLLAPGASLGGARPKANFYLKDDMWIAKFPSKNDIIDKAAWEYLVYRLARDLEIQMSYSSISPITGGFNTFMTIRFDRVKKERIHFASAMTMTGNSLENLKKNRASYLDIAEFIKFSGANVKEDLKELWTRIVFSISISNTDDHLRNHGFLLTDKGWILSPAFDINPSIENDGLALNIDNENNALDFDLAKDVGKYFMLNKTEMSIILRKVKGVVRKWRGQAYEIGISGRDQELMEPAFKF